MKANMRRRGKVPLILGLRWRSAVNITPLVDLLLGKNSAPAEEEAGGTQSRLDISEMRKIFCPYWDSNPGPSSP